MSAVRRDLAKDILRSVASVSTVPASVKSRPDGTAEVIDSDAKSSRPTSVPDFDMTALAGGTVPRDSAPSIPLDLVVPTKVAPTLPAGASPVAVTVFQGTDGTSTLAAIASRTGLSLIETISAFIELLGSGAIDVETDDRKAPIASGVFPTIKDE